MSADDLRPSAKELQALRVFVSGDETCPSMANLWAYLGDAGTTYVATDGHTLCLRRAGSHREMKLHDIHALPPMIITEDGNAIPAPDGVSPAGWDRVIAAGKVGNLAPAYGMNPGYFARIGDVEKAVGARSADDFQPPPGMSKKDERLTRAALKTRALATLSIPSDALDGWYWRLSSGAALWEGMLMPRRV